MLRFSPRHQPANVDGEAVLFGDGRTPFAILAVSTTGCFATRDAQGQVRIHRWYFNTRRKEPVVIEPSRFVAVWSCRAPWDTSRAGWLTRINCLRSGLHALDVRELSRLSFLCCPSNYLTRLNLTGLEYLRLLDCRDNDLTLLDIEGCRRLRTILRHVNPQLRSTTRNLIGNAVGEGKQSRRPDHTRTSLFDV
jgi:hypothetical protein